MNIEAIARVCHEANRVYCLSIGDTSQLFWGMTPDWQKKSAVAGVQFHIANPDAGPEASHECWLEHKMAEGWVYGDKKCAIKRTHPCCVPFDKLPREQQMKDILFRSIVHAFIEGEK